MKKFLLFVMVAISGFCFMSCSANDWAAMNRDREARTAKYQSDYAKVVNKLEMKEGNFKTLRRVVFYNVRNDSTVFVCEGYSHVQIDGDGDVEVVVKTGEDKFLRHYLGKQPDCTYFSEQLESVEVDYSKYRIYWNPSLWMPQFTTNKDLN